MSRVAAQPETITRNEAISRLREVLLSITDEETCVCKAATERNVFCRGFRRLDDKELRERYWWIVRRRPDITREELEGIAEYVKARDFTLVEFLREKQGADRDHKLSLSQFLHRVFLPGRSLKGRRNEFLAKELEQVKSDWLSRIKSGIYSYEQRPQTLPAPYAGLMQKQPRAWTFFQAQPPGYRKLMTWYVVSAKKDETRMQRFQRLLEACARGQRLR